jgi:Fic family protein
MRRVVELVGQNITPELICEIHGIVTDGTLDDPGTSGRLRTERDERVTVQDVYGEVLHTPPPAAELPERVQRLCDFANDTANDPYIPPALRAITIHFMIGYDHPFEDGNGRTARALFYWSMLRQGYWLTEFLTISRILRDAPAQYARSFLHTELYLARKMSELRDFQTTLKAIPGEFNHRQVALLTNAMRHPGQHYSAVSHARSHDVSTETARQDLLNLEQRDLLVRGKIGKAFYWTPASDLSESLMR